MKMTERPSMLSPFAVGNYRFQWSSDLMTSCATEMETIILGWFIFVESDSVALLTHFASLQYFGTLIAPAFGLAGDRLGHRNVILYVRTTYALLAVVIAVLALPGTRIVGALTGASVVALLGIQWAYPFIVCFISPAQP